MVNASTPSTTSPSEQPCVEPIPPRFWWLKRILVVSGVLVVSLVGLRLWWGWDAHRRLQAEIDRRITAGEPVYPGDFNPDPIPDDQNAAKFLQDAELALNLPPEQQGLFRELAYGPANVPKDLVLASSIVGANAPALALVQKARQIDQVDWGVRYKSPAINTVIPSLWGQREIVRLLSITAAYHHARGDDYAAIETIRDWLAQTRMIDAHPALIAHLVASENNALAVQQLEWITASLRVSTAGNPLVDPEPGLATRAQIEALIVDLLDEMSMQEAQVRAMWFERMLLLDCVQMIERGDTTIGGLATMTGNFGGSVYLLDEVTARAFLPVVELDGLWMFHYMTALAETCHESTWPAAVRAMPPDPDFDSLGWKVKHPVTRVVLGAIRWRIMTHYRLLAEQRMAATALALRLHEIDYGRRPAQLAELVPAYLLGLPPDPFSEDARPLGYRPDATPPELYSVYENGVDDGGQYALRNGRVDRHSKDLVFFLNGDRPRPVREKEEETPPRSPGLEDEKRDGERGDGDHAKH